MYVTRTERDGVVVLTADRPPVNAISVELLDELCASLRSIAAGPPRALVLAGRPGSFSAGVDLKAITNYDADQHRQMVAGINEMVVTAYGLPCPVVAAITGHAIAGGFVLAVCADYRVAATEGRYGLTEVKVGVPYPAAAIGVVRSELTAQAARILALGNRLTSAGDCVALGAFDEALGGDHVLPRALEVAHELAALPAEAYAKTKRDLRKEALETFRAQARSDPLLGGWVSRS